jgi:hypothetical protein
VNNFPDVQKRVLFSRDATLNRDANFFTKDAKINYIVAIEVIARDAKPFATVYYHHC